MVLSPITDSLIPKAYLPVPSETLHLRYSRMVRPNRHRVENPVLQACARLLLWVTVLVILVAVLIKIGIIWEPDPEFCDVTGFQSMDRA